jgi:hypothetical protein
MKHEANQVEEQDEEIIDLPASAALSVARKNKYGSVPGLDDEELADPDELERQVMLDEWGAVLQLPVRKRNTWVRPSIDESGHVDWGAFGTVDFERRSGSFDKRRYKVERLREELRDVLILASIVQRRVPEGKLLVIECLRNGIIELEHIVSEDMRGLGRLWLRAERIRQQIREVRQARRRKVERLVVAVPG